MSRDLVILLAKGENVHIADSVGFAVAGIWCVFGFGSGGWVSMASVDHDIGAAVADV